MATTSRTFDEITTAMLTYLAAQGNDVTDLRPGSVVRTILEAVAIVSQQFDEDRDARLDLDIANSAMRAFGFGGDAAQQATGTVILSATNPTHDPILIPAATLFGVPGTTIQYRSVADFTIAANAATVTVPVKCVTPGVIGNVPAESVTQVLSGLAGIQRVCRNGAPFINGRDAQTDLDARQSFARYVQSLHRGTEAAIDIGVSQAAVLDAFGNIVERVGRVTQSDTPGSVTVYLTDDTTQTVVTPGPACSEALVMAAQVVLDGTNDNGVIVPGYKAAGVVAIAAAATAIPKAVNCYIAMTPGYVFPAVQSAVQQSVINYFNSLTIGENLDYHQVVRAILAVRGVYDFSLLLPSVDQTPATGQVITLIPFQDVTANPPIGPTETVSWIQEL